MNINYYYNYYEKRKGMIYYDEQINHNRRGDIYS